MLDKNLADKIIVNSSSSFSNVDLINIDDKGALYRDTIKWTKPDIYYKYIRPIEDKFLVIELFTRRDDISSQWHDKKGEWMLEEGHGSQGWNYRKGIIHLRRGYKYGKKRSKFDDVAHIELIRHINENFIIIPRTISEIIQDYNPDIEGIVTPPNSNGEKEMIVQEAREDPSISAVSNGKVTAVNMEGDKASSSYVFGRLAQLIEEKNQKLLLDLNHVTRSLIEMKEVCDLKGLHYRKPEEVEKAVEKAKGFLEEDKILYNIIWNRKNKL